MLQLLWYCSLFIRQSVLPLPFVVTLIKSKGRFFCFRLRIADVLLIMTRAKCLRSFVRPDLARPSALNFLPATISQDYFDGYELVSSPFVFARVSRRVSISEQAILILIVALAVAARRATSD